MKVFLLIISICFLLSCQKQANDAPAETVLRKTITLGENKKTPGEN
jgi:hypothetical protein